MHSCRHLVVGVAAEVRGSEFQAALKGEEADAVAALRCILLGDGVHTRPISKTNARGRKFNIMAKSVLVKVQ